MAESLNKVWDIYLDAFRRHSHQLLAWAHDDVRASLHAELEEPSITGLLAEAMKRRLNADTTPDEYLHYWIGDQEPVSPNGEMGNDRLRLDINVIRTGLKPRLSYIFEAKRLRTGSFTIGKYTGTGGMGDFLECRYGEGCPEAAMVGLLQNKDADYWFGELQRSFTDDLLAKPGVLRIEEALGAVTVLPVIQHEWQSRHRRSDGSALRLLHIFLPGLK
jgi:hypothetical protein